MYMYVKEDVERPRGLSGGEIGGKVWSMWFLNRLFHPTLPISGKQFF